MKNNHWIWMIIGCGLPLLFIFLAPSFGIGGGSSLFIFILLCSPFTCLCLTGLTATEDTDTTMETIIITNIMKSSLMMVQQRKEKDINIINSKCYETKISNKRNQLWRMRCKGQENLGESS